MVLINSFILATNRDVIWADTYRSSFCSSLIRRLTDQRRVYMHKKIVSATVSHFVVMSFIFQKWIVAPTQQADLKELALKRADWSPVLCRLASVKCCTWTHHKDHSQRPADSQTCTYCKLCASLQSIQECILCLQHKPTALFWTGIISWWYGRIVGWVM